MNKAPTTLIIMDGFGLTGPGPGNAVSLAQTPQLDRLFAEYAHTTLSASGLDVGLPAGQMGNSEVGHTNIGGGRVVFQDLPRITKAIADGSFDENPAYRHAMDACLEKGTSLHLMGLLSDGGVHSHLDHLFALLQMAKDKGLTKVYIHAFLDGRDVSPTSGADFVAQTVEKCREVGVGKIATVMGRYYAMDRDKRWDRVQKAYDAIVCGQAPYAEDAAQAASHESCQTDDTVQPQERDVSTEPQTASDDNAANAGAAQYFTSTSDSAGSGQTETTQEDTVQAPASLPSTLQTAPQESTPQQEEDTARKETTLIQDIPASITTAQVDEENSDGETGASSPQENTEECFAQLTLTPDQAGTLLDGMDASEVVRDPDTGAELQRIYYLDQQQFQDLTAQLEDVSWTDSGSGEWAKVVVVMQ